MYKGLYQVIFHVARSSVSYFECRAPYLTRGSFCHPLHILTLPLPFVVYSWKASLHCFQYLNFSLTYLKSIPVILSFSTFILALLRWIFEYPNCLNGLIFVYAAKERSASRLTSSCFHLQRVVEHVSSSLFPLWRYGCHTVVLCQYRSSFTG